MCLVTLSVLIVTEELEVCLFLAKKENNKNIRTLSKLTLLANDNEAWCSHNSSNIIVKNQSRFLPPFPREHGAIYCERDADNHVQTFPQ